MLIGVVLLLLQQRARHTTPLTLAPERLAQLRAEFVRQTGAPPNAVEEAGLITRELDDELLYREAVARGLDRGDPAIRHRLVEKMRFLTDASLDDETLHRQALSLGLERDDSFVRRSLVEKMRLIARRAIAATPPDELALERHVEAHADTYRQPPRVRFEHVFVSRQQHGAGVERRAEALLAALQSPAPPRLDRLGDPFPITTGATSINPQQATTLFGARFAERLLALPPGLWTGPIASPFGLHLVRVAVREPARMPALAELRGQAVEALRVEQGNAAYAKLLRRLRKAYGVDVVHAPPRASSNPEPG